MSQSRTITLNDESDAAPLGRERQNSMPSRPNGLHSHVTSCHFSRRRRRGPRSQAALLRRSVPKHGVSVAGTCGESQVDAAATTLPKEHFSIYCLNIRCLLSKLAELKIQIERLKPHLIIFQETWLDACIESVKVPGYVSYHAETVHVKASAAA